MGGLQVHARRVWEGVCDPPVGELRTLHGLDVRTRARWDDAGWSSIWALRWVNTHFAAFVRYAEW